MAAFIGPRLSRRDKVRLNTDPVFLAIADGLYALAMEIGEEAARRAPDAPAYGQGLPLNWGANAWALGKKVAGDPKVQKPRAMRLDRNAAQAVVGFGFPARFNETGTVNQPARPFFGPVAIAAVSGPRLPEVLSEHFPPASAPNPKAGLAL
jgi:hypothetical protein